MEFLFSEQYSHTQDGSFIQFSGFLKLKLRQLHKGFRLLCQQKLDSDGPNQRCGKTKTITTLASSVIRQ